MKKYIVCWMEEHVNKKGQLDFKDHYEVFIDESSKNNYGNALVKYTLIAGKETTYSCNLCEIKSSTDY